MIAATKPTTGKSTTRSRTTRKKHKSWKRVARCRKTGQPLNGKATSAAVQVATGNLPFQIVDDMFGFDVEDCGGSSPEMSEWLDRTFDDSSEQRRDWAIADLALQQGRHIAVSVKPENAVRVTSIICSLLKEPLIAKYKPELGMLIFWSQTDPDAAE